MMKGREHSCGRGATDVLTGASGVFVRGLLTVCVLQAPVRSVAGCDFHMWGRLGQGCFVCVCGGGGVVSISVASQGLTPQSY